MVEISAVGGIGQQNVLGKSTPSEEPASREILDLFEHLLGQKVVEPSGAARETIAAILANPSTLGDHILANVEGMHRTFHDFSSQIEARLAPPEADGMSLTNDGSTVGGVTSDLSTYAQDAGRADHGPAVGPLDNGRASSNEASSYGVWHGEMQELLWVQYNVGRILVHEEMMSKAAGKSTQNLDMLLRGQ